jgi:hypothetical protein
MCGVEESGNKGKRTSDLCGVAPLDAGVPFEIVEDREVWHPVWKGKIDDGVNAQFIKMAATRIWDNEQVSICILSRACILIFCIEASGRP